MKKRIKSILALTALVTMTIAITSCKKEEPAPTINFNNATAQYVESFLGKSTEEFKKACEESGMILEIDKEGQISYCNEINRLFVGCKSKNNIITWITYEKGNSGITTNKEKFIEFFNYVSGNNYAAFKGWNNKEYKNLCYKDITEYRNSLNLDIKASNCEMIKSTNGVALIFDNMDKSNKYSIEFASPEDEIYGYIKSDAMSSCN